MCVLIDSSKAVEQELELKRGADKIIQFYKLCSIKQSNESKDIPEFLQPESPAKDLPYQNLPKYSTNILRKIGKEWLKALEGVVKSSSKTEWIIKDLKDNSTGKVVRKDLVYRCQCLLNDHSGIPGAHILGCIKDKSVEQIIKDIVVHPKF